MNAQRYLFLSTLLAGVILLAGNIAAQRLLAGARIDFTEGGLYTLSHATRTTLEDISEPVDLTLVYARKVGQAYPAVQAHAARVRELLASYQAASGGRVRVHEIDPSPFSEAEDTALAAGIPAVPASGNDPLYFGIERIVIGGKISSAPRLNFRIRRFTRYRDCISKTDMRRSCYSKDSLRGGQIMGGYELRFSLQDLRLVAGLIGKKWDHYGSRTLFNEGTLAAADMFLTTSSSTISVVADYKILDFEGGVDEFSFLRIQDGAIGATAARRAGDLYFDLRGEQVVNVLIIRDTVAMDDQDLGPRELVVDSGFIVETTQGSLAICKGSFYMQDMFIQKADDTESLELVTSQNEWESSLGRQFSIVRTVIPVNELLEEQPNDP